MARRSTDPAGSSVGMPCTWQRKPRLANSSAWVIPDLASRRLARTSCVLLPMDETMPIPVTTTRLIAAYPHSRRGLSVCLLYTSDAADDLLCVDLGGRRIIKKK